LRRVWRDPRRAWLHAELVDLWQELPSDDHSDDSPARELIAAADTEGRSGDIDSAWQHRFRAERALAGTSEDCELRLRAITLAEEIKHSSGRLPGWRDAAILQLLRGSGLLAKCTDPQMSNEDLRARQQALAAALRVRDTGIAKDYWRLAIIRHYQLVLMAIGAPFLVATIALLAIFSGELTDQQGSRAPVLCVHAALIGVLGAITSAAQRSTQIRSEHVIAQLGTSAASFSRIPIGAVAGLTVWLFSIATADAATVNAANLLLAAFGAGFAERLIVQGHPNTDDDQSVIAERPAEPERHAQRGSGHERD
jgi:hypothetical protein